MMTSLLKNSRPTLQRFATRSLSLTKGRPSAAVFSRSAGSTRTETAHSFAHDSLTPGMHFPQRQRRSFASSTKNDDDENKDEHVVMVSIEEAQSTTAKALEQIGWDAEDAALQAEIMTAAELCGNNQGLVKMYQPSMMKPAENSGKPVLERETGNSAVYNANQAPGMLAAVMAADKAVELLHHNNNAISIVSAYNTSTSSGQLAFYVERMARKGYIGIAMANSPEFVAAAAGGKPVFGTNPMAVGIPQANSDYPFTVS
jgi:hypothetical protein